MKLKIAAAMAATFALQGCAFNVLNKGLPQLVGEPLETAVNVLGLPNAQMPMGDSTIWVWSNAYSATIPIYSPTTSTTTGYVGTTPISTTTTTPHTNFIPVQYQCEIKLVVDSFGVITRWEYFGNEGGCEAYAGQLRRAMPKK